MPKPLHIHPTLQKGYGWKRGLPTTRHPLFKATLEAAALPPVVDLRPQCPAVYDQGQLGSCTGNAWAGLVEFLLLKEGITDFGDFWTTPRKRGIRDQASVTEELLRSWR